MFKESIEIEVFIYSEEEIQAERLGILDDEDAGLKETEIRYFWVIDCACKFRENNDYTCFYSSGESYVTPQKLEDFIKKINNHK